MSIYIPYTYLVGWSSLNKWYYGVRYRMGCSPDDLWHPYKTSSKYVHEFVRKYGDPDIIQVRKTFACKNKAHAYEQKVLTRLNILENDKWLNCGIGGTHNNPGNRTPRTINQKAAASKALSITMSKRSEGTFTGRKHKPETILLLRNRNDICPHCGYEGRGNVMKRWHFNNCKSLD
jgi:hypothetical protein